MKATYQELDFRNLPRYSITEASRYLLIPVGTLRSWIHGRSYPTVGGKRYFQPLINLPDMEVKQLSFINLVEAHVLRAIRKEIRLDQVRTALNYIEQQFNVPHPLARIEFQTDGVDLFVNLVGYLVNESQPGQVEMQKVIENLRDLPPSHWYQRSNSQLKMQTVLENLLRRIEWDENGVAIKLFPFIRSTESLTEESPKSLVIDPRISFGRPVLVGTEIPTAMLAQRYKAGESIDELAKDYDFDRLQVEEAIRCELSLYQAA